MNKLFLFSAAITCCVTLASAAMLPVIDTIASEDNQETGYVNWTTRVIYAHGIGAPNPNMPQAAQRPGAIRAAQQIALRNALETLKGIAINSTTTVNNFMTESDVVSSSISGFVKGFKQKGKEKYMSDGSVEVTMAIPLDGISGLDNKLFGTTLSDKPSVTDWEADSSSGTQEAAVEKPTVFTGLIIDCKGLGIKPALSPRILDEAGKEVYGSAFVSREWVIKQGMVGYAREIKDAAKLDRVGKKPGKIKALKASTENGTDIIISNNDADDIRSADQNLKFLSECRVVFVVD